jgi:hypothetical protein
LVIIAFKKWFVLAALCIILLPMAYQLEETKTLSTANKMKAISLYKGNKQTKKKPKCPQFTTHTHTHTQTHTQGRNTVLWLDGASCIAILRELEFPSFNSISRHHSSVLPVV